MELPAALAFLREDSLLSIMPPALAERARALSGVRSVQAGEVVARAGEVADRFVISLDCALRLRPDSADQPVGQLGPRRTLNLAAVLQAAPWAYTAEAEGAGHVLEIPAAPLIAAIDEHPGFSLYLRRTTELRAVRDLNNFLRAQGVGGESIQRLVTAMEERSYSAGELLVTAKGLGWLLVSEGRCELTTERAAQRFELGTLAPGDFYGGSAVLLRMRAVEMRGVADGRAFVLSAATLRELAKADPRLHAALGREKPELVKKVRRALIDVGAEYTQVLQVPAVLAGDASDSSVVQPLGTPWPIDTARMRRLDTPRCTTEEDSGGTALAALLRASGRTVTPSEIRRRLKRHPPSLLDLATVAEQEGFSTHPAKVKRGRDLARLDLPLLTVVGRRYVVVYEVARGKARLFDPLSGFRELPLKELEACWRGAVLTFRDVRGFLAAVTPSSEDAAEKKRDGVKKDRVASPRRGRAWTQRFRYLRMVSDVRGLFMGAAVTATASLILSLLGPKLSGVVIDDVLVHGDRELLVVILTGMVLLNLSSFALEGLRSLCVSYLSGLLDNRLSTLVYRHTLGVDPEVHGHDRVGRTSARFAQLTRIRDSISDDLIEMLLQVAQGLVCLLVIFFYSWRIGAIVVGAGVLGYAATRAGGARMRTLMRQSVNQSSLNQSVTTEQIEAMATIKAVSGSTHARTRWEEILVSGIVKQRELLKTSMVLQVVMQSLQRIATLGGLYFAVRMILDHEASAGEIFAATQYLSGALAPLFFIAGKLDELEQLGVAFERVDGLIVEPLEDDVAVGAAAVADFEGAVTVRGLGFRYGSDGADVLSDVSFEVQRGQRLAIVGRSGSGKTTLARILQGTLRPTSGELLFDDLDGRSLSVGTIRRNVGIVMQESHLFAGTIAENIAYGDDRPDQLRVREAARMAAAHDFITQFPAGYATFLAEGGLGLSGGQRQRVSLARALYRDPRILILDEATSALDAESERAIMTNMREILRGRTAIVIAHRLHTVKTADVILVLDQGKVVERGNHAELIARRGLYHALFSQQFNQA